MKKTPTILAGIILCLLSTSCAVAQIIRGPVTSTPFTRTLLDDADAAEARSTLGISGSTNYVFETSQFTTTGTNQINLKDGLTVSNIIVKTAMTNDFATASRALFTDANKKVVSSTVTTTELELMQGVTTRPAGTNVFEANQFDIRAGHIGLKDSALTTNLYVYTQLLADAGSAATPSVSAIADQDTGIYFSGGNEVLFATSGTARWKITSGGGWHVASGSAYDIAASAQRVRDTWTDRVGLDDGSGAAPALTFASDLDTGIYRVGADQIGFSVGGSARWRIDTAGIWTFTDNTYDIGKDGTFRPRDLFLAGEAKVGDGSVSAPSLSFDADENTGIYRIGSDNIGVTVAGSKKLDIADNKIQNIDDSVRFMLVESGATVDEGHWALFADNDEFQMQVANDAQSVFGKFFEVERTGTTVDDIYLIPASSGAVSVGLTGGGDSRFHVKTESNGDGILRLEGESGGGLGDIVEDTYMSRIETTDATVSTLHTLAITASRTYLVEARVTARRTGGAAGTADDGAVYIRNAMVTTKSGTVTINAVATTLTQEDQAGWDCTLDVSGSNIRVRVTGAANNTIDWACKVTAQTQGL